MFKIWRITGISKIEFFIFFRYRKGFKKWQFFRSSSSSSIYYLSLKFTHVLSLTMFTKVRAQIFLFFISWKIWTRCKKPWFSHVSRNQVFQFVFINYRKSKIKKTSTHFFMYIVKENTYAKIQLKIISTACVGAPRCFNFFKKR